MNGAKRSPRRFRLNTARDKRARAVKKTVTLIIRNCLVVGLLTPGVGVG